ncbi:hypothetical protein [Burkholderia cenocepacia]|uniref:hypothetical protein n=1 Tax=Burkholderia cepacia complex TaxID=87882 RepID=UPI00098FAFBE|nr:hypothetical protein BHQ31_29065 [Burkholderia cenocepacia]MBJ9730277.1 hypothetical protein [Burkholderia cenocepacia]MBR8397034.1 hypothetical protein [Burkholderia cenocepacia]HEM7896069.1 hypothetical protein [Burkholderia cenocepacia]
MLDGTGLSARRGSSSSCSSNRRFTHARIELRDEPTDIVGRRLRAHEHRGVERRDRHVAIQ